MTEEPLRKGKSTDPKHAMYPDHADTSFLPGKEDEMLPTGGKIERMPPPDSGGDPGEQRDTAGEHGEMAVESAKGLDRARQGREEE